MKIFPDGAALVLGASGGIGSEVARVLARDGADLALVYNRNEDAARKVARDAKDLGRDATVHQCDVTDPQALSAMIKDAAASHGRLHSLIWCAGPLVEQLPLNETPREAWDAAFQVETFGLIQSVSAILAHMREQGGGTIVHLGSAGHRRFPERDGLSVVPKAANEAFLKGIAREEGQFGIRANSVLVGVIEAGMFKELSAKNAFPEGWEEETQKALCLKRWGQPEEIGAAVSFLASDKSSYITGETLNVSGGFGVTGDYFDIVVSNYGLPIYEDEMENLYEKGVRGREAVKRGIG
ncbi:MAG: SDR family oxidoreductase, partial [Sphingomonadaceae bacterium]|nr:SDR family oxidoreductase [Sphingomonadaceae bacterium]